MLHEDPVGRRADNAQAEERQENALQQRRLGTGGKAPPDGHQPQK